MGGERVGGRVSPVGSKHPALNEPGNLLSSSGLVHPVQPEGTAKCLAWLSVKDLGRSLCGWEGSGCLYLGASSGYDLSL